MPRKPINHTMHRTSITALGKFFQVEMSDEIFFFEEKQKMTFNLSEKALRNLHEEITLIPEEIDNG